jgi:hypothetical protein
VAVMTGPCITTESAHYKGLNDLKVHL